jgi:DNA-binding response OmpR family regulator
MTGGAGMSAGRILLADDDRTFSLATADLLRKQGFECEAVADGATALARATEQQFDLLITDLEMPGNADLELVRSISERVGGLPVIILTGYASVRSAIASVELPVAAYLTKPVEFPVLLEKAQAAVTRFRAYQAMHHAESRLKEFREEFAQASVAPVPTGSSPVDVFLTLTLRNVMGSLTDLEQLGKALSQQPVSAHPCQLLNCPRGSQLRDAVVETVRVLEETKGAFKSKTLGDLRHRLELMLAHN